jgi:hypothetical protein
VGGPSPRFPQLAELRACIDLPPSNAEIGELRSREASEASYILQRAYLRGARSAFLWEVEARDLVAQKRPLTELAHIGPFLQKQIRQWIRRNQHPSRPPPLRKEFLTLTESRLRLAQVASWGTRFRGDFVNFMPLKELRAWIEKVRNAEARRTRTKTK